MQTHKLNKKAIAVTGLPEGTYPCHTYENTLSLRDSISGTLCDAVGLPTGNWRILGFAQDLKEEDWKLVVEYNHQTGFYKAYSTDLGFIWNTAAESGHSLLKSKGLYVSNPFQNPDATNVLGSSPSGSDYEVLDDLREQYQSAQLLTNPLILIRE